MEGSLECINKIEKTKQYHTVDTTLCDKVCQWLTAGRWFSPDTPVSSTNKTGSHDITEILLKVYLTLKYFGFERTR
jgi:hypothetical protein